MNPRTLVRVQPPELDAEARALHALSDDAFIALMRKAKQRPAPEPDGATLAEVFAREAEALVGRCFALNIANLHDALTPPEGLDALVRDPVHALRAHVAPEFAPEFVRLTGARRVPFVTAYTLPCPYAPHERAIKIAIEAPPLPHVAASVWWSAALGDGERVFIAGLTCGALTARTLREWNAARLHFPLIVSQHAGWSVGQFARGDAQDGEPRASARMRYTSRVLVADGTTVVETPWGAFTARDARAAHALHEYVGERARFAYEVPVLP